MYRGRSRSESPRAASDRRRRAAEQRYYEQNVAPMIPDPFATAGYNPLSDEAVAERMTVRPAERHVPFWQPQQQAVQPGGPTWPQTGFAVPRYAPAWPFLPAFAPPPLPLPQRPVQIVLPPGTMAVPTPIPGRRKFLVHGIERTLQPLVGSPRSVQVSQQGNRTNAPLVHTTKGPFRIPRGAGADSIVTGKSPIGVRINRGSNGYGDLVRNKPPANVFVPDGFDIGMLEILTFFPNWLHIPDVIVRAVRNGWLRKDIAKAQLNAIDQLDKKNLLTTENRIQKQISDGCKTWGEIEGVYKSSSFREDFGWHGDLTAVEWHLRMEYEEDGRGPDWGHYKLANIYGIVPRANWPKDEDRLLLTQCLEFADDNNHLDFDTSHIGWMIDNLAFDMPFKLDSLHDGEALKRLRADVADPQT